MKHLEAIFYVASVALITFWMLMASGKLGTVLDWSWKIARDVWRWLKGRS